MSEKRFTLEQWTKHSLYYSDGEYSAHMSIGFICEKVEKKLNEQQATINELQQSQDVKEFSALFNQSIALQREIKDLKEENEQLKKSEKINMEYAEQIVEENHKLRIAKNDLRIENEQLIKEIKSKNKIIELYYEMVKLNE